MDSRAHAILAASRRGLLRGGAGLVALAALAPPRRAALAQPPAGADPFAFGVASGDPTPDGVVLWTRLATAPLEPGGGMPDAAVPVLWELAEDDRFARILQRGRALAEPRLGHSVHVELAGLAPGSPYFYRFHAGAATSPTGRTRTAPPPDSRPERLRFVNAGCQMYEHGWFTAWRHIAAEPALDFVFHYGDYIYEYAGLAPGQPGGFGPAVRSHLGGETITLADYRLRYAQYRLDPDLQAAHAAHPFIASFDDHEVDNNWAGPFSEEDGRSWRHPIAVPPEIFALRKAAAFQAWYEFMPLRRAVLPRGPEIAAFRRLRFGRLAEIHVLDTRSFRDDQPCNDVTGPACPAVARADAQMLGPAQEAWLTDGLARSGATWQVLAQQVMMMRRELPNGAISMDKWDAYPAARARLLAAIHDRGIANPVILSGDVHNAWAGTLRRDPSDPRSPAIATEFTATSITSTGDGSEVTNATAEVLRRNPHIAYFNNRRGYTLHEATASRMTATFRAVPFVTRPDAPREDRGRFVVEAGRPEVLAS